MSEYYKGTTYIAHSAKGSSWKKHKYVKVIDGVYYYPVGYTKGRTVKDMVNNQKKTLDSKEKLSQTLRESEMKANKKEMKKEISGEKKKLGKKRIEKLANKVIAGKYGVGQDRMDKLGKKYNKVQNRVNQILLGDAAAKRIATRKKETAKSSTKIGKITSRRKTTKKKKISTK